MGTDDSGAVSRDTRLDDVDWAGVAHAYGSATDLPGLFARVRTGDDASANRALGDIAMRICHQDIAVEEATAPAVAVLASLAATSPASLAERILDLLCVIAESLGTWARCWRGAPPEYRPNYEPQMRWEPDVLEALQRASPTAESAAARLGGSVQHRFDQLAHEMEKARDRLGARE